MSESIKNLDATTARIAGNICAGLVTTSCFHDDRGVQNQQELVAAAVGLARQIVAALAACAAGPSDEATGIGRRILAELAELQAHSHGFAIDPLQCSACKRIAVLNSVTNVPAVAPERQ